MSRVWALGGLVAFFLGVASGCSTGRRLGGGGGAGGGGGNADSGIDLTPGEAHPPDEDHPPSADVAPADTGPGAARLTIDSPAHDFGTVVAQTPSADAVFVVKNAGTAASGNLMPSLTAGASGFSIKTDHCGGMSLAGGATCEIVVIVMPASAGAPSADLTVSASPGGSVTAHLTATAIAAGALKISPGTQDFGTVVQNRGSASQTFTVSNSGQQPTGAAAVVLGGTDKAEFQVTADGCGGQIVPANGSCQITVRFGPTGLGSRSASLTVSASPGGSTVAQLSGAGIAQGTVTITPDSHDYGSVQQMTPGASQVLTVKNTGQATTGLLTVALGGTDKTDFSITANGCDAHTLASGITCAVTVQFTPMTPGSKLVSLSVAGAPGEAGVAQLTGTSLAKPSITIVPFTKQFNSVTVNLSASATFVVSNPGGAATGIPTVTVAGVLPADSGQFSIPVGSNGCTAAIPAVSSCMITVRFAPTTAGIKNGTLTVSANPGTSATATLTGTGVPPGRLSVTPLNQDFGSLLQGTKATTPVTFTLTNSGGSPTGTLQASVIGSTEFQIMGDTCSQTILGAGATCTVGVIFAPTSASPSGTLQIVATNPADSTSAGLSGIGLPPAKLVITPTSSPFADTVVNQTSPPVTFTVRNSGGVSAGTGVGLAAVIQGTNMADFAVVTSLSTCAATLAAGASCTLVVTFTPKTAGNSKTASLNVSATPGGPVAASVTGNGLSAASLTFAPAAGNLAAFGNVVVGVPKDQTFVVSNTGQQPSSALQIALVNTAGPGFSLLTGGAGDCAASAAVAGNSSCNVRVHFAPAGRGMQTASLAVSATSGGAPAAQALTGTGQLPAGLSANPASVSLGPVVVGVGTPISAAITNGGDVATGAPALTNSNAAELTVVSNGCTAAIGPGIACAISLTFRPSVAGLRSGTITVTASGSSATVSVSATGTNPCGAAGQACCTAAGVPPCGVNLTCNAATCAACGGTGQPCCGGTGGTCNDAGVICTPAGACTGVCVPGTRQCLGDTAMRTCNANAQWNDPVTCVNVCRGVACAADQKVVFVTSRTFPSNMGGLAGADALCMQSAAGNLVGTFKAWLSDSVDSPSTRLTHAGPYVLPSGVLIANNWAQLTSGTLLHAINLTELMTTPPASLGCVGLFGPVAVWSDTLDNGTGFSLGGSCANWTSTNGLFLSFGRSDVTQGWSASCNNGNGTVNVCNTSNSLYCFQQ